MKAQKDFYTHEEILNEFVGEAGTPDREAYNMGIELALIGYKVKELREAANYGIMAIFVYDLSRRGLMIMQKTHSRS